MLEASCSPFRLLGLAFSGFFLARRFTDRVEVWHGEVTGVDVWDFGPETVKILDCSPIFKNNVFATY